jgi:hypothetical protein
LFVETEGVTSVGRTAFYRGTDSDCEKELTLQRELLTVGGKGTHFKEVVNVLGTHFTEGVTVCVEGTHFAEGPTLTVGRNSLYRRSYCL